LTTLSHTSARPAARDDASAESAASTRGFDPLIVFLVGVLLAMGAVMVQSASIKLEGEPFDWRAWWSGPLKQTVFAAVGLLAMLFAAHLDYRLFAWDRPRDGWWSGSLMLLSTVLLIAVLFVGVERGGAQRAIILSSGALPLSFQPSELAKVALVLWLAALLTRPWIDVRDLWRGYLPAILSIAVVIALTGKEDFGTAALMGVVAMLMLLLGGARWLHLLGTALVGAAGAVVLVLAEPYRVRRILTFFAESPDASAEGYQVTQSLIAIGSGGWWGEGLGAGVQKYDYLPQANNDFIFAILCEELGIVGGLAVVAVFLMLLARGAWLARKAGDPFGRLLASGVTLMICLQAAFNIAVVTDSVPTKGISLPFVSAGGSGAIFLSLAAGLLASVGRTRGLPPVRSVS
jgi:cell division protein FtsW